MSSAEVVKQRIVREAAGRPWLQTAVRLASPAERDVRRTRGRLARRFLRGDGIEIGALHLPLAIPRGARVRYVDRMDRAALEREYPDLRGRPLVDVDLIDDGERLTTIDDASVDFVIANHFIEHTEDPIATLRAHTRVLREGGILFLAVPDKRATFDRERPVTPLEHNVRDAAAGPEISREEHFADWARHVERVPESTVAERGRELQAMGYSIHFHVWTPAAFTELLVHCRSAAGIALEIEGIVPVRHEFIAILRRTGT